MAGEQEDQRLVPHLLGIHGLAGVGIAGTQQPRQQILALGSRPPAVGDELVHHLVESPPGARHPAVARRRPGRGWRQRRHRTPERVTG